MIITRIRGGLGNQLFQYSCGRSIAKRIGTTLLLDLRDYTKKRAFPYSLSHFKIVAKIADNECLPVGRGMTLFQLARACILPTISTYREDPINGYDSQAENIRNDTLLKGYWQSERYFEPISAIIRSDLSFKSRPTGRNSELLKQIEESKATVSIHIRRGDYISNDRFRKLMETLELTYYSRALEYIVSKAKIDPIAYIFSDEPDYAQSTLSPLLPCDTYVMSLNNRARAHEDLRLMAACQHHIIANSTFSWWGAWLNPSPTKIVVAPKRWFRSPSLSAEADQSIVPVTWHRM